MAPNLGRHQQESDHRRGGVDRLQDGLPLRGQEHEPALAACRAAEVKPRGSKNLISEVSGSKNHSINGVWDQKPEIGPCGKGFGTGPGVGDAFEGGIGED